MRFFTTNFNMANTRDSDTSLWLHNKLGTSNDSWTTGSICSQLNVEVLRNIKDCFPLLQTQVKLKLLLSFFHIPRRNVEEWKSELEEILEIAQIDTDQWVSMLAEIMKTLPRTGSLNTEIGATEENKRIFSDLVNDLRKLVRKHSELTMLPLECHYLNKSILPPPTKHFNLKRKPKSSALRAELLQKSQDAANNIKKSTAPTIPLRSRGMPRKMTDTTPLKGIPSRLPGGGFRSPSLTNSSLSRPPMPRNPAGRKDGGIKLLDITEQPLGYAQAKKKKRLQEMEEARKASEVAATQQQLLKQENNPQAAEVQATPDYAAGLTATNPPTPAPAAQGYSATATIITLPREPANPTVITPASPQTTEPPATPGTSVLVAATQTSTTPSYVPLVVSTNLQTVTSSQPSVAPRPVVPTAVFVTPPTAATAVSKVIPVRPATQVTQFRLQPASTTQPRKGLSLSREQMLEAQDMFRTANKVTRPEKALILGFMAGARDNPCPHLGNIVTIKLSENQDNVQQSDGTYLTMLVETHFQMNYNTGEWKRIKKYRKLEDAVPAMTVAPARPAVAPS